MSESVTPEAPLGQNDDACSAPVCGGETRPAGPDAAPASEDAAALDITHPDDALAPVTLQELPPSMQAACARAGWTRLMPVQSTALPYLMDGRDIMIQSRTGSGKTGTYLLPLVPALRPDRKHPQALVLVPTRELALQVAHEAGILMEGTGLGVAALYGGVGYQKQLDSLRDGAQLVIGTPGRVLDHLLRRSLSLDGLRALVFDEADRMLSIGFYPDMKEVQRYLPRRRIYTSLFSATYPQYVLNLAAEFMTSPSMLSLSQKQVYVAEVQHCFCRVRPMDKDRALIRLIEVENPSSAIIFCNTKANVHYVAGVLQGFGYNADELSADLSQNRREEVMAHVREGRTRLLVATDVAARGIDIPELSHVFLYEPPEDHESYIHRAGRTGRANCAGTVISLVDIMECMELERIAKHYSLHLHELADPSDEEVARVVSHRLLAIMESRYRRLNALEKTRIRRYAAFARELANLPLEDESEGAGVNLLGMLLDACHHNTLDEVRLPKPPRPRRERDPREGRGDADREDRASAGEDGGEEGRGRSRRRRKRHRSARDDAPEAAAPGTGQEGAESRDAADAAPAPAGDAAAEAAQDGTSRARSPRRRRRPRRSAAADGASGSAADGAPDQE